MDFRPKGLSFNVATTCEPPSSRRLLGASAAACHGRSVRCDTAVYGESSRIVCRQPAGVVCVDDVGYIHFVYQAFQRGAGPVFVTFFHPGQSQHPNSLAAATSAAAAAATPAISSAPVKPAHGDLEGFDVAHRR